LHAREARERQRIKSAFQQALRPGVGVGLKKKKIKDPAEVGGQDHAKILPRLAKDPAEVGGDARSRPKILPRLAVMQGRAKAILGG
jgi:hypothetical protein